MKVGFLCPHNHLDRNSFSGTVFYIWKALLARSDIDLVSLVDWRPPARSFPARIRQRFEPVKGAQIDAAKVAACDVILAPVASSLIAQLPKNTPPIVFVTDATPKFLRDAYNWDVPEAADDIEALVLDRATIAVYSSAFMAERAKVEFAHVNLPRIKVQPFGLNLDFVPPAPPAKPSLDPFNVLIIAQDWHRKGGDIAVGAVGMLRDAGVDARLTCIGAEPDIAPPDWVTHLGYLDKNDAKDAATFTGALTTAHVFLLPTRADCTPMVVAEANAYGCPVIIRDTGGIASLMNAPCNGMMVCEDGDAEEFGKALTYIATTSDYADLSVSSHEHCIDNLTWDAWVQTMVGFMRDAKKLSETT